MIQDQERTKPHFKPMLIRTLVHSSLDPLHMSCYLNGYSPLNELICVRILVRVTAVKLVGECWLGVGVGRFDG